MNSLLWLAIVLLIAWVALKLVFAVTSLFLHVLWIIAVILFVVWLVRKFLPS